MSMPAIADSPFLGLVTTFVEVLWRAAILVGLVMILQIRRDIAEIKAGLSDRRTG